ncbi:MAG: hypothetical protein F4X27_03230 [Chloroflexi bacterium]|nr:hypothetical protein [Chloroflexota bacterium]
MGMVWREAKMDIITEALAGPFQYGFMVRALIISVIVGVMCPVAGVYVVARGLGFMSDGLAHSVLPGVVAAAIFGSVAASVLVGGIPMAIIMALISGYLIKRAGVSEDASVGILFAALFAIGVIMISVAVSQGFSVRFSIEDLLLGNVLGVSRIEMYVTLGVAGAVMLTLYGLHKELVFSNFDPTGASVVGLPTEKLEYLLPPAGSPEDFRLTSVWGYPGLHHFFALGSAVGLYLIEPEDGIMEQIIPASEELRPINVSMSHDGEALLVVMSDGELRMYDAHDLDLLASADDFLTEPVETGFWARPHVVTAPGAVFITDSLGGEVLQLDDHDLEVVNHWDVDGNPTKIAFVGIYGETEGHEEHGHEEEHDEHEDEDEHGHAHAHGEHDPHFWFDPVRVQQAVNVISAQLSTVDSAGQTMYRENAAAYNRELDDLHAWITEQVAALPEDRRVLVTSHDAYQYYAQRYGFEVVGTIFPLSTEVEPSAQDLAMLAELIEHEGVPVVFGETTHSDRMLRRIAEETGAIIVTGLYSGSLGEPGGEAGNYLDMMRFNTTTIVEALK